MISISERFCGKVTFPEPLPQGEFLPDGCWEWTAAKDDRPNKGYGFFGLNGKNATAHRVSWQMPNGSIPDGLMVLHECDNPPCVNPNHLHLGTHQDNMAERSARGRTAVPPIEHNTRKTHCRNGHPYSADNTYNPPNSGERQCRTCKRINGRRSDAKRYGKAVA